MTRLGGYLFLTSALLGWAATGLNAQEGALLRFAVVPGTGEATVEVGNLLEDPRLVEAVNSGLPLRIRILIQLWKEGFFDDLQGQYEWRASILFDPLTRGYRVQTGTEEGVVHEVNTLEEARETLQGTLGIPLRPRQVGRYYYEGGVELETLSLSDFEELQRWLQGELGPAVVGTEDMESAVARGFRRLLVRLLGLPARRFQVRSPTFEIGPPESPGPSGPPSG